MQGGTVVVAALEDADAAADEERSIGKIGKFSEAEAEADEAAAAMAA